MPWWAYLYLTLFVLLTIAGIFDEMHRPNKLVFISAEVISAIFVVILVTSYFHSSLADKFGILIFVMVGLGMVYEIFSAQRSLSEHKNDSELTPTESKAFNNISLVLGNIIVVPGYVFGFMAGLRHAGV